MPGTGSEEKSHHLAGVVCRPLLAHILSTRTRLEDALSYNGAVFRVRDVSGTVGSLMSDSSYAATTKPLQERAVLELNPGPLAP